MALGDVYIRSFMVFPQVSLGVDIFPFLCQQVSTQLQRSIIWSHNIDFLSQKLSSTCPLYIFICYAKSIW